MERQGDSQPSLRKAWIDGEIPRAECGGRALGSSQNLVSSLVSSTFSSQWATCVHAMGLDVKCPCNNDLFVTRLAFTLVNVFKV